MVKIFSYIIGYIKRLVRKKDLYRFLIGTLDYKIARRILKGRKGHFGGIGIPNSMSHLFSDFAKPSELSGRWTVNVSYIIKHCIPIFAKRLPEEIPDIEPDVAYPYAARIFIDAAVIEEVCHAMDYLHDYYSPNDRPESLDDFFQKLAVESYDLRL